MKTKVGLFLELNGLLDMVIDEMSKCRDKQSIEKCLEKWGNDKRFFYAAFNWDNTILGASFWIDKNKEYIEIFDKL